MSNLFDLIEPGVQGPVPNDTWRPEAPPDLSGFDEIYVNFETTGFKWWAGDLPIGMSVWAGERGWYLPWGHRGGGNLSEEQVYRFAQNELKGKRIININTRFDTHMGRVWGDKMGGGGLDFDEMGCSLSDVAHYAGLLDDHRRFSSLDSLIPDFLKEQPMARLDESRMKEFSAGAAAPRSIYNVEAVMRLKNVMWPMLNEQGLQKVRQLEDEVIPVVCEMEKNGTLINVELMELWIKESLNKYHKLLMELYKDTGLKINPNSSTDQTKLFRHLKIPITSLDTGSASFTDAIVKGIDHPTVKKLRRAKKYASIHSKLKKYQKSVDSNGILRYALHQMRAAKAEGGETGTVVGRFTSTEIVRGVGINIQQVLKPEKQLLTYGDEYFIRELHIPAPGQLHFSSDAEQIQYRLFAHEANNPKVLAGYQEDPWMSFHRMTLKMFRQHKPDLSYKKNKDVNFANMFSAGPTKLGFMLEFITETQYKDLKAQKANRYHPWLATTLEIIKIYDKELPEVKTLSKEYEHAAKTRGFIRSILGRRMRFPNGDRIHKSLNGRIIMSEADIVKTKAVQIYKARKVTGMTLRFQVHDEFDGDVPDKKSADDIGKILNYQSFPSLRVPILWGMKTGDSWGACAADELKKLREEALL